MVYPGSQDTGEQSPARHELAPASEWGGSLLAACEPAAVEPLRRAIELAEKAHAGQTRASGEPYISHTVAVAEILAGLRLDSETLIAAILHDTVEDTALTLEEIEAAFGAGVARLVNGVTKMNVIDQQALDGEGVREQLHSESLRKMLLAMAEDVRVVLIKLADRLHNMRTLKYLPEAKQRRIARETLDIYAPLANRLGIWQLKWELEDLAFRFLDPEAYHGIARQLDERRADRERYIEEVIATLETQLDKQGIRAEITGRPKHIYSIWRKMRNKGVGLQDLYDVRAVRIIVEDVTQCYAALGVVHTLWGHIPREFDDYIATPKENNYQSIHTAVIGPGGRTLEVQIRTREMHEHAELGVAAHWRYKEGGRGHDAGYEQKIRWLRQLLEWKEESTDAGDFIDRFKSEVFQDRVYVLTPEGDVRDLPQGATPLDFAYYIHTEVGNRCRGARVDGRIVPLTYQLRSGQQVEVLTARQGGPSRDWLNRNLGYLNTSRARAKVRHWFKLQDHEKNVSEGRGILDRELQRLAIHSLSHADLAEKLKMKSVEDLYAAIGRGDLSSAQISNAAASLLRPEARSAPVTTARRRRHARAEEAVSIHGVGNLMTRMARCCKPTQGDPIVGYITQGHGVTVHRRDCRNILALDERKQMRLIAVDWEREQRSCFPVDIRIEAIDRQGLLRDVTNVLANEHINVLAVTTRSEPRNSRARMDLTLEVADISELSRVLDLVGQLRNVYDVRRLSH